MNGKRPVARDDLIQFARSWIKGDVEANDEFALVLDEQGWEGWPELLAALFILSVRIQLGSQGVDDRAIIRFVADLRIQAIDDSITLDALQAESLIRAALSPTTHLDIEDQAAGTIEVLATHAILTKLNLSAGSLDTLLEEAYSMSQRNYPA